MPLCLHLRMLKDDELCGSMMSNVYCFVSILYLKHVGSTLEKMRPNMEGGLVVYLLCLNDKLITNPMPSL